MSGGYPTACGITWCEGEAGAPVTMVWLPGRRAGLEESREESPSTLSSTETMKWDAGMLLP
jgi:hypothetical protein